MKAILLTAAAFSALLSSAQIDSIRKPVGNNTLGIAFELGGGVSAATDIHTIEYTAELQYKKEPSWGLTCFYEHQFNFNRKHGLILGVGLNATLFSPHVIYENTDWELRIDYGNGDFYTQHSNTKPHDLGKTRMAYFSVDLPLMYVRTFVLKNNWNIAPYTGIKFRNVAYISGEQRNVSRMNPTFEGGPEDTTFYMNNRMDAGTYATRIIVLPTLGVKVSKALANDGKLNFFADYSYGLLNHVEAYYSNFDNTEKVEVTHNDNGTVSTTYETTQFDYVNDQSTLFMALNMSHFRAGASYTLPHR